MRTLTILCRETGCNVKLLVDWESEDTPPSFRVIHNGPTDHTAQVWERPKPSEVEVEKWDRATWG